ncbi:FGGY-family carbohydrate kinase [Halalkalibaculum sp. DA384]|uniref:FGGY-family carbohydrate kinase n=1 Tax=Halalkalibaculum sp. DA384 TaxID=3373606 RepID=UPI003754E246
MKQEEGIPVTAVFDIGKTNKKFLLFDERYRVVFQNSTELDQTTDDDGDSCEDLEQLVHWIGKQFENVTGNEDYRVEKLNFSTYGATLVHLDKEGQPVTPLYNYLKDYPEPLQQKFYDQYGGQSQFSIETASPPMGMLNSGLQLYWLKYRKQEQFKKINHTLHFPQYLSYLFTDKVHSELTSIGCHTGMWNFRENGYHRWLEAERMLGLLPDIKPVGATYPPVGTDLDIQIGNGIHDSSAALAPYLIALEDPFLLVSTGTWSISFNPFNTDPLTFEELKRDCLCYMNIYGEQVKASRLFLGKEYMHQKRRLESHFNRESTASAPELDPGLLRSLINEGNPAKRLQLEQAYGSGPYPQKEAGNWKLNSFESYQEAYHQLMLDLVSIQTDCIGLVEGEQKLNKLIVTGGFSQNKFYMKMLASAFPGKKVYTASLSNASALGAALVINDPESFGKDAQKELLDLTLHTPLQDTGIEEYRWKSSAERI